MMEVMEVMEALKVMEADEGDGSDGDRSCLPLLLLSVRPEFIEGLLD
jgi:hypothetical protein